MKHRVDEAHHQAVDEAPGETGNRAVENAIVNDSAIAAAPTSSETRGAYKCGRIHRVRGDRFRTSAQRRGCGRPSRGCEITSGASDRSAVPAAREQDERDE